MCACAVVSQRNRTLTYPAQYLSSCQRDLHPPLTKYVTMWDRSAGKRPLVLYRRRDTDAGCQILSSREQGLRGSQETVGGGDKRGMFFCVPVCMQLWGLTIGFVWCFYVIAPLLQSASRWFVYERVGRGCALLIFLSIHLDLGPSLEQQTHESTGKLKALRRRDVAIVGLWAIGYHAHNDNNMLTFSRYIVFISHLLSLVSEEKQ